MNAKSSLPTSRLRRLWPLFAFISACGTVAGNPKKPGETQAPAPTAVVYTLPLIDFTVPEEAAADDASLQLTTTQTVADGDAAEAGADKSLLRQWARRMDKIVREVDAFSKRLNKSIEDEGEADGTDDQIVRFKKNFQGQKVVGKVGPLPAGGDFDYQALLCHDGKPILDFRWSKSGDVVELTRDFAARASDDDQVFDLLTRIRVERGAAAKLAGSLSVDVLSQGTWTDNAVSGEDGGGLTERAVTVQRESGEVSLKVTGDKYVNRPEAGNFEGDYYLTGLLAPTSAANPQGKKAYSTTFVGYFKGFKLLCRPDFDDEAEGLWHPDGSGSRFCFGRPAGAKRFKTIPEFRQTVASLEEVGIVKKADLGVVEFSPVSCE